MLGEARKATRGCTRVIHAAEIARRDRHLERLPYTLTEANNALCSAVIRAALELRLERFMYVSSPAVFERAELFPTPEDYLPSCPTPTFGAWLLEAHGRGLLPRRARGARAAVHDLPSLQRLRPGRVGTGRAGISHVVADLIRKALSRRRPLQIFGTGEQTRTLTHVDDIADGVVTAMARRRG